MADLIFDNSGTFDGLDATLQATTPKAVGGSFQADIVLSQSGVQPSIDITFAIDTSGSTANSTGIDFNGDGEEDTFLEAQVYAAGELLQNLVDAGYTDSLNVTIVEYSGTSASSITAPITESDDLVDFIEGLNSSGNTPYNAALTEIEDAWDAANVDPDGSNFVYFFSDGFPIPSGQDFETPLESLEASYNPVIRAVGFGDNTSVDDLETIDNTGQDVALIFDQGDIDDLLNQPPPLPGVESFDIIVDGEVIETIPIDDPRVTVDPAIGFVLNGIDVGGYDSEPGTEPTIEFDVQTNFTNGETLVAGGPITLLDGIVEGTDGADLIDADYDGDPECDMVDAGDAILPGEAPDDDIITAGDGNDTVEAGLGDDDVFGEDGDDVIDGGVGDDVLDGGDDDDELDGGDGNDTLEGGDGSDTLTGGEGVDLLQGGDDEDLFIVNAADDGQDVISGGDGGVDLDEIDTSTLGTRFVDWDLENVVTDSDGNGIDGDLVFLDGSGGETGRLSFTNIEIICFTPGTLIATPHGPKPAESLCAGDRVLTRDNGVQEIAWYGQTGLNAADFKARPHLAPILIRKGALGNGLPKRDMMVSPQHRVLVTSDKAALYFDDREVLVAAKHLVNGTSIVQKSVPQTTYIHFMCAQHEVVLSDGAWTESFQPGDFSLNGIDEAQRREIVELFPDLATERGLKDYAAARRTLKRHEALLLTR